MLRSNIHKFFRSSESFCLIILMNTVFISVVETSGVTHYKQGLLSISKADLEASCGSFIITLRPNHDLDKFIYLIDTCFLFLPCVRTLSNSTFVVVP